MTEAAEYQPVVNIIMGSASDWETMKGAAVILDRLGIIYECRVVSAHRTPDRMFAFAREAEERGIMVIIAGAGGAAHLPGMVASLTTVPVIGVPVKSKSLSGMDSLLSIAQMPKGVPVATMAIGGSENAGLFAVAMIGLARPHVLERLKEYRKKQTEAVYEKPWSSPHYTPPA
jgi:5-(carboxyamino)imidazole ribonucleotide mutase